MTENVMEIYADSEWMMSKVAIFMQGSWNPGMTIIDGLRNDRFPGLVIHPNIERDTRSTYRLSHESSGRAIVQCVDVSVLKQAAMLLAPLTDWTKSREALRASLGKSKKSQLRRLENTLTALGRQLWKYQGGVLEIGGPLGVRVSHVPGDDAEARRLMEASNA